jgi:hypothetical protein
MDGETGGAAAPDGELGETDDMDRPDFGIVVSCTAGLAGLAPDDV